MVRFRLWGEGEGRTEALHKFGNIYFFVNFMNKLYRIKVGEHNFSFFFCPIPYIPLMDWSGDVNYFI